ncbi:unnamed protein product [Closterium sp. NIES-65]|nr:unnamed protein product [Closterium sp. NIES-65]
MKESKLTGRKDKERATDAALNAVTGQGGAGSKAKRGRMEDWRRQRGAFIVNILQPIIEKVGPEHVVAICTVGGSNYVSAGKMLQKKYPHIEIVLCPTHVLDLLMEEFGKMNWAQEVVTVANDMISFLRIHQWARAFLWSLELHGEEKSLQPLRPAGMRFGTHYIGASCLRQIRPQLMQMVMHKDWEKGRKQQTGKNFEASVLDAEWWKKAVTFVKVMELVKLICCIWCRL